LIIFEIIDKFLNLEFYCFETPIDMNIIIHPNFRNGGAERSAINLAPDKIITYGPEVDVKFCDNFSLVANVETKTNVLLELFKITLKNKNIHIKTNQLSSSYFWVFAIFPNVRIIHYQRLSLFGELMLCEGFLKKAIIKLIFAFGSFFVEMRVPSLSLKKDFRYGKHNIVREKNNIFPSETNFESISGREPKIKDIVIIARDGPEKKLKETLFLLDTVMKEPASVTIIGSSLDIEFVKLKVTNYERILNRMDLMHIISQHKIGVLFSAAEGFGNVVVEFIVAGTWPIVNNCKWGPAEIVNQNKIGDVLDWDWTENYDVIVRETIKINKRLKKIPAIPLEARKKLFNEHSF